MTIQLHPIHGAPLVRQDHDGAAIPVHAYADTEGHARARRHIDALHQAAVGRVRETAVLLAIGVVSS